MATHSFRDLWRPSLVLFQNEQHKEMLPTVLHSSKKIQEIKDQQLQISTKEAFAVNGFNEEDRKQLQWLPSSI